MKTAIVYATKYGCTKECAEILKTYLHGEVNILSAKADKINLSQYDAVFIGGSVYMGKIQKEITQFCKRNLKQLLHTKITSLDKGIQPIVKCDGSLKVRFSTQ